MITNRTSSHQDDRQLQPIQSATGVEPFAQMQRNMMEELERRRSDWEKEVERMQEDFFQVKLHKPETGSEMLCLPAPNSPTSLANKSDGSNEVIWSDLRHHQLQPEYFHDDLEDRLMCRWRFDVHDFQPDEVSVRAEGRKLCVTARHVEVNGSENSVTKQFSKQIDIPSNVHPEKLTSFLTRAGGFLTVQAPVEDDSSQAIKSCARRLEMSPQNSSPPQRPPPSYQSIITPSREAKCVELSPRQPKTSTSSSESDGRSKMNGSATGHVTPTERHFRPIEPPRNDAIALPNSPNIIRPEYGEPMLKMVIDLGRSDYEPRDVSVQVDERKLVISAEHEETTVDGRSLSRQFSRDVELPEQVHGPSVRASLDSDGKLWIGASLESNTNHRNVTGAVLQFMPRHARPCNVEFE